MLDSLHAPAPAARPHTTSRSSAFLRMVRSFRGMGTATCESLVDDIPYLANEFWTSAQRKAHPIHEVSYRACFKAQLPEFFVAGLTEPGDTVLDPFMGRGTTPLQAAVMGRCPVGNDVNPLSSLLVRPRLCPPDVEAVEAALRRVPWETGEIDREDLLTFYHPDTLRRLCALRRWLAREAPLGEAEPDTATDWIRMVALNRLTGHSTGFLSGYTLPPNQAVSVEAQRRINARLGLTPPERDVAAVLMRKTRSLLKHGATPSHPRGALMTGPASRMPGIPDASVELVVTSPPFLDVVQYADDNWLRCWFAGIDPAGVPIAMHRDEGAWRDWVRGVLVELARVTRPEGHLAFEVGEVRGGRVLLERLVWSAAEGLPLERLGVIVNAQEFTKTANLWGVGNNAKGTNTNRIVLLRRA